MAAKHVDLVRLRMFILSFQFLLLVTWLPQGTWAQLTISAVTAYPSDDGSTTNSFVGSIGSQIAGSLLDSGTPALLWGTVPQDSVDQACNIMVDSGTNQLTVHVDNSWGTSEDLNVEVTAIGGCLTSGTQAVFTDDAGRTNAIICDSNGCGVYITGDQVNELWNQGNNGDVQQTKTLHHLRGHRTSNCASDGATWGSVTGVLTSTTCIGLLSVPFIGTFLAAACVPGMIGVNVALNAAGSCAYQAEKNNCFPDLLETIWPNSRLYSLQVEHKLPMTYYVDIFSGDALVLTQGGVHKAMMDVVLGEKVAVWGDSTEFGQGPGSGVVAYEEIYAFGHKDRNTISNFVKIDLASTFTPSVTRNIELSALHFVPTISEKGKQYYKRAKDISEGDVMLAMSPSKSDLVYGNTTGIINVQDYLTEYTVTGVSSSLKQGLFNPFTMHGTILVNNVVASVHSEWFLDAAFDKLGITHQLPNAYQMILSPARMLYKIMDKASYTKIYTQVDNSLNFEKTTNALVTKV